MTQFKIGDQVERKGSPNDYTTGRRGIVIEFIPGIGKWPARFRVLWHHDRSGSPLNVRTWCEPKTLKLMPPTVDTQTKIFI